MSGNRALQAELVNFGSTFRALRRKLKWTQSLLAQRADVSRDTIHRLEHGGVVDVSSLIRLLSAMGYRLDLAPKAQIRAADMRRRFAHLHEDSE
jgi:transcriptional regulator with XRE-family HTH domain